MMKPIILQVPLFRNDADRIRSQTIMLWFLNALCMANRITMRFHPDLPNIYESGVRYVYKDQDETACWQDIMVCVAKGYGDCKDFAAWRAAELIEREGVAAKPAILWRKVGGAWRYHAVVELPDGSFEDPSAKLGMGSHRPFVKRT